MKYQLTWLCARCYKQKCAELGQEPDAIITLDDIEEQIAAYESRYGYSSAQMLEMVENNTAPDDYEVMDWRILLGHR
jgi:hypothetical protein